MENLLSKLEELIMRRRLPSSHLVAEKIIEFFDLYLRKDE